jgi:hypothetical protein
MVDLTNQSASLLYAGTLENPIGRARIPRPAPVGV